MDHRKMILVGGWCMLLFSILFMGTTIITDILASGIPSSYDLTQVGLFQVAPGTKAIKMWLTFYAILPMLLIPSAVGAYYAFQNHYEANMRCGMYFAALGAGGLSLSLMLLPSFNWIFTSPIPTFSADIKPLALVTISAMHSYFGMYVGDILGIGSISIWLLICSIVAIKTDVLPGVISKICFILVLALIVTMAVRYLEFMPNVHVTIPVGGILCLWLFLFGIGLISLRHDENV